MKIFSFGGGVQFMAVLILSAQGKLDYTDFIFANVGNDSENPKSLEYINNVAIPYANKQGLRIIEVSRQRKKDDRAKTLHQELLMSAKYITIPVYLNNSGPQSRSCTSNWKIEVINKYVKKHCGATKTNRVEVGVGISTDESH
jgi:3'-phosphoadenosine 5'-phosphosulfate sulfotransferase (PAPS reductase)/FAD synthetase